MNVMQATKVKRVAGAVLAALCFATGGQVLGHHAAQGFVDGEENRVTVTGVVKEFRWANPLAQLYLNETLPSGVVKTWGFQLNSPGTLVRRGGGWSHTILNPGVTVTATFNPAMEGQPAGECAVQVLADGRELVC